MIGRLRLPALIAGLTVFLVLAGTTVSYASWTTSSSSASASATSTNAAVQISSASALTTTYSASVTGPVIGALTLTDSGGAPLGMAMTTATTNTSLATAISLKLWLQSAGSCGSSVPTTGVSTGTLASPPALPSGATSLAAGAAAVVCAATSFTGAASSYSGQSTSVTLTVTGSVGTSWRPTASTTFTQSIATATPAFTCTNGTGVVTINWPNTTTATTTTTYRSLVNGAYPSGLADRSFYYREFSNQGIAGTGLPNVAGTYSWLIMETTNGVTTTAYAGSVVVSYYQPWGAWIIQCGS